MSNHRRDTPAKCEMGGGGLEGTGGGGDILIGIVHRESPEEELVDFKKDKFPAQLLYLSPC